MFNKFFLKNNTHIIKDTNFTYHDEFLQMMSPCHQQWGQIKRTSLGPRNAHTPFPVNISPVPLPALFFCHHGYFCLFLSSEQMKSYNMYTCSQLLLLNKVSIRFIMLFCVVVICSLLSHCSTLLHNRITIYPFMDIWIISIRFYHSIMNMHVNTLVHICTHSCWTYIYIHIYEYNYWVIEYVQLYR